MALKEHPFTASTENFLNLKHINNIVVTSITDEESLGDLRSVGSLQFLNREYGDVQEYDCQRVETVRKLVGAALVKCGYFSETLQAVLGFR